MKTDEEYIEEVLDDLVHKLVTDSGVSLGKVGVNKIREALRAVQLREKKIRDDLHHSLERVEDAVIELLAVVAECGAFDPASLVAESLPDERTRCQDESQEEARDPQGRG